MIVRMFCAALVSSALLSFVPAHAQDSGKTIRLIVPFTVGGSTDKIARQIAPGLAKELGEKVVVLNKVGAGGIVGTAEVAQSPPDGYTLGIVFDSLATNHHMTKSMPYDTFKSLHFVSLLVSAPQMLVTPKPYKSLAELIQAARSTPGKVLFASTGLGTSNHLFPLLLGKRADATFAPVPYNGGGGPFLTDLLGGRVDFTMGTTAFFIPHFNSGALRPLATGGRTRSTQFPDVPAIAETFPGFEAYSWIGVVAPAGLPKAMSEKLNNAFRAVLESQPLKDNLLAEGFVVEASTEADFLARVTRESERLGKLIKEENIAEKQ